MYLHMKGPGAMAGNNGRMAKAKAAIKRRDIRCFDVCDNVGQIFDNVKHMSWFVNAVADELYPVKNIEVNPTIQGLTKKRSY
jgi:hypothetical protein